MDIKKPKKLLEIQFNFIMTQEQLKQLDRIIDSLEEKIGDLTSTPEEYQEAMEIVQSHLIGN